MAIHGHAVIPRFASASQGLGFSIVGAALEYVSEAAGFGIRGVFRSAVAGEYGLARADPLRSLEEPLAGGIVLEVDQAASAHQVIFRDFSQRGKDANLDRHLDLRSRRHRQEAGLGLQHSLYTLLRILSVTLFEKMPVQQALSQTEF